MINLMINTTELVIKMGWSFISVQDKKHKLVLPIEQRIEHPDMAFLPTEGRFSTIPMDILTKKLSEYAWNRRIEFEQIPMELNSIPLREKEYQEGMLESTVAGEEYLSLDLFDPGNDIDKEVVKEIWLNLEKRFAEAASGFVSIYANSFDEDSVFSKITIPTLMENENVTLNFIDRE